MKILLICSAGMSTSLLVRKMEIEAERRQLLDIKINADSVDNLENLIDIYDVIMIGPQIRYKEKSIGKIAKQHNKAYTSIPPVVYGRIDGAKTLDLALEVYNSKK